jgi:signal transduction histidine kinase
MLWSWAGGVSIKVKIMGIVLALILIFGLAITLQVRNNLTTTLTKELEKQGVAITKNLAARSTDLVLTGNSFDLYQLLENTVEHNEEVRYAIVLDPDGNVLSHSFSGGLPVGLAGINIENPDTNFQIERLETNEGLILDIAVPVFGGRAGTSRVGMSTHLLNEAVADSTIQWIIIASTTALIGLLATYWLTAILTKPILQLVEVTKAITKGDLKRKAQVWAQDEIGRLAFSFNEMTEYLAKARGESETFQAELVRRNLELAALNSIATETSRSQDLADIMRRSLVKVIKFMDLNAGWVNTLSEDGHHATVICHTGLADETVRKLASGSSLNCACKDAVHKKSPVLISGERATCPILKQKLDNGETILCHVAVPLISKLKVFGILYVASSAINPFTTEHLNLLHAVGHQMGITIENVRLWEELKYKEELRGHLLVETISAQETERKRIARELHDQAGQLLTSLMVGLKMLEEDSPENIQHKILDMRQLAAQTLDEVHSLALELRPSSLDDLGLVAALEQYTYEYTDKFGVKADFQTIGFDGRRLSPEVEITLYRIIQEALTNIVKHAEAEQVSILLEIRGTSIVAIVEDNGKGLNIQQLSQSPTKKNLGIYGMYERAALIEGKLTIESEPSSGTTIFVEVPMKGNKIK